MGREAEEPRGVRMTEPIRSKCEQEVARGQRFRFGRNWASFLRYLSPERIKEAEKSLKEMLGVDSLVGKDFLDIGSGSGLFSLAAKNLAHEFFPSILTPTP